MVWVKRNWLACFLVLSLGVTVAHAEDLDQAWEWCSSTSSTGVSHELRIKGCTTFIESIQENDENRARAYNNRGVVYQLQGDLDRALDDYSQAIKLSPGNSEALNNRGVTYRHKGDLDRAIEDFNQAIKHDRKFADAYNGRGIVYLDKGDNAQALKDMNQAIKLSFRNGAYIGNRGQVYAKIGDLKRAEKDLSNAIRLNAKDEASYRNIRCWARATLGGNLDDALKDCNRSLELRPNHAETLDSRGLVYLKLGRFADAVADYDIALKSAQLPTSLFGRGVAKLRLADLAGGNADIAAAKKIDANIAAEFAKFGVTP